MRLDKFLSNNTSASRTEVRRLIKTQAVQVNGIPASNAAMHIAADDDVLLNNTPVVNIGKLYYMLHKPAGTICANQDGSYPTVLDLLAQRVNDVSGESLNIPRAQELQIAGRLDLDTTGLVLITNDGQWNHQVTSPNSGCKKVYAVTLAQAFNPETRDAFSTGIQLDGEKKPTLPATIELVDNTHLLLTIQEGKYHQIKRMFAATGNSVIGLHRLSIGQIKLDPTLKAGQFRPLTQTEITGVNQRPKPEGQ